MDTIEKQWIPVDTYKSIRVSKYGENYSIMLGNKGDQDTYDSWCNPLKWSNGQNVPVKKKDGDLLALPFRLPLGKDKQKALKILESLAFYLKQL